MKRPIYLDHNATARVRPEVIDIVAETMGEVGNASSVHAAGRRARRIVEEARREVAMLVGAPEDGIVFVSGGTEANNQVMQSQDPARTLVSTIEHPAVQQSCPGAGRITVDSRGLVDITQLEARLAAAFQPGMVAVMLANNETGVIQPVAEIADLARMYGAVVHCDAVQAAGKIQVDFRKLGVNSMALSAHKFGGPQGVGALVLRNPDHSRGLLLGGGQERGLRAGTEAVALIAGFGMAARLARESLHEYGLLIRHRRKLEDALTGAEPGFRVFGRDAPRLPNTSLCLMPGVSAETQLMAFDLEGIAISAGSACSSGRVEPSHVLAAMGIPYEEARCSVRVSLGQDTQAADIERFVEVWKSILARAGTRRRVPA